MESIQQQTFSDLEIIITDDSPDDSVAELCKAFSQLPIRYYNNEKPLGTPANWNRAVSLANGDWIKLMHDDDWFAIPASLQEFQNATGDGKKFIFSAYTNVFENNERQNMDFPVSWKRRIVTQPMRLLARNVIGPPSVTMIHASIKEIYDTRLKWRVDMEYYVRLLGEGVAFHYIDKYLLNVGVGATQVTNYCLDQPEVELPEGLVLLEKYGVGTLKNILVYDAWWRILRNVNVRNRGDLKKFTGDRPWPQALLTMADHQSRIPQAILKQGIFSKPLMTASYFLNLSNLK